MKFVFAPDSFKGTFTSLEVIEYLQEAAKRHFPKAETVSVPIADGGEGTVEAVVTAAGGRYEEAEVTGPLGERTKARYGIVNDKTAIIELAQASGLTLVSNGMKDPLRATTFGTGELIRSALDAGIRDIYIGIGGSATNDGGIGLAQALGVRFKDAGGADVGFGGGQLARIREISFENLDKRIQSTGITVISDVQNTLTGENGATFVYGPQKGAAPGVLEELEEGMVNYSKILKKILGRDIGAIPGSGAAGGAGAALAGLLGAKMKPGIEEILDLVKFDSLIEDADLVVTGEGKIDGQSVFGKAVMGIGTRCRKKNVRVAAIAGIIGEDAQRIYDYGIDAIMSNIRRDMSLEEAIRNSAELMRDAADRMFRLIKLGMEVTRSR